MKANKFLFSTVALITLFSANLVKAEDGRLTILGGISAATCNISTADQYKVIRLPYVGPANLTSVGSVAAETRFSIGLENCPTKLNKAGIFFENGPSVEASSGYLKAYKLGATAPNDGGGQTPGMYNPSKANKDVSNEAIAASGTNPESSNLRFELLDNEGSFINIGDGSQLGQSGLFTQLTSAGTTNSGRITGSVRYRNVTGGAPDAGYYFSHVGFVIQYP